MKFNLNKPCKHCPFRSDVTSFITATRADEICREVLANNKTFQCHETLDKKIGSHCAGALILTQKAKKPNAMQQIAERLGLYQPTKLKLDAPVYGSHNEMVETHKRGNK